MARELMTLVTQVSCNTITKKQDQTLNVRVNYTYQGPEKTGRLGAVVTQELVSEFDEIGSTRKEIQVKLPESLTPTPSYSNITGLPLSGCEPKSGYGIKVYALDIDGKPEWGCKRVLTVQGEEYKGTISKKQLEYNGTTVTIPAYNIPQNKSGLVHIWGRNDTSQNQTLGIGWTVTDPDGVIVERHENDWASGWVGAGQDREFIGGRFNLNKAGTYRLGVILYMKSSNPVEVSRYEGTLCTVVAAPPEEYKGTISKKELEYNESRATIPASSIPQGKSGLVHIWGRNDMATTQRMGIWWQVKNPAGTVVEEYGVWEASPYTSPGGAHEFIGGRFTLDRVGTYTIDVVLYMNPAATEIVQRYTGTLCTVVAAPAGISFQVSIWGVPTFGSYQKWWAYYWDPGINDFVSCGKWYSSSEKIPFSNVKTGGYLAVFLMRNSTVSSQYTSPTFQAVNGGSYTYDVQTGVIYG